MYPMSLIMFALIGVLIFFMFRNGKKRQQAQLELLNNLVVDAEVMLQSGIFGKIVSVDEANDRITIQTGTAEIEVHRNAVANIVTPVEALEEENNLAPDDDPEFGERLKSQDEDGGKGPNA